MHDPAERPEFFPVGLAVPQTQLVPVFPQNLKPALRAEMEGGGKMQPVPIVPLDLTGGKPVPDAVRQIHQQVLKTVDGIKLFPNRRRNPGGPRIVDAARQDLPVQRQQRPLALAHFRREMLAAVFHIREQQMLFKDVPLIRKLQNAPQPLRGQPVRQIYLRLQRQHARAFPLRLQSPYLFHECLQRPQSRRVDSARKARNPV